MILSDFRVRFPEFAQAGDTLVQAHLDEAEGGLDSDTYGTRFDEAHGLLTAHLLTLSPYGRALRQEGEEKTLYERRLAQVKLELGYRATVA